MTENVYIHIPFCRQKCRYCSFVSYPELDKKEQYLSALKKEIKHGYRHEVLKTLYFGGGTPSLLRASEIADLTGLFCIDKNTEITVELNPEAVTFEYLCELKSAGVNRLSIGCQTFDDEKLAFIGRKHTSEDVIRVVNTAYKTGFENVSLDFIYGLPQQTVGGFERDLLKAVALGVQHISLYGLKIEEGCYFASHMPVNLPDQDLQADMYLKAIDILKSNGYGHYEMSNFAKPGFYSRHNLNYWDNNSYYGFGIAAHGYIDGVRYSNFENFNDYFNTPDRHGAEHFETEEEILEEEIFLGFRKMAGISVEEINKKFAIDFEKKYAAVLKKYLVSGHIIKENGRLKLTDQGILVSNIILSEFME